MRTSNGKLWVVLLAVQLVLVSFSLSAQQFPGANGVLVLVKPVTTERESRSVSAVGTAQAKHSVMLFPAVGDVVTAVHFRPGQRVEAGAVLLELDARRQLVALERARLQLADAERTVRRLQATLGDGGTTQSTLDDAITARDLWRVTLSEAETELEDRYVRAPYTGVVGLTDVNVGDRISPQTAITSLDDRSELFINFRAPEAAFELLTDSPNVNVQPWQNPDITVQVDIAEIDSRINELDRTVRVRALLDNRDDRFRPGMSFRVSMQADGREYLVIPEAALLWGATGAYVWVAKPADNGHTAVRVDVQIKQRLAGRILVTADMQPGELLVLEGIQSLRSGQALRFTDDSVVNP